MNRQANWCLLPAWFSLQSWKWERYFLRNVRKLWAYTFILYNHTLHYMCPHPLARTHWDRPDMTKERWGNTVQYLLNKRRQRKVTFLACKIWREDARMSRAATWRAKWRERRLLPRSLEIMSSFLRQHGSSLEPEQPIREQSSSGQKRTKNRSDHGSLVQSL